MPDTTDGVLLVDKPAGMTSHSVVGRLRRLVGTRRVGHAGTLDPMATGVLVLGVGRATRLLGYLTSSPKTYAATLRLGEATHTDDADGEIVSSAGAPKLTRDAVAEAAQRYVGRIDQVPSSVSAVKVQGRRAHQRVRQGEAVVLDARPVEVLRLDVAETRKARGVSGMDVLDVDVEVECSAGTYIRALARDIGADLGVGGHLVALRRTRSGPFDESEATPLEDLDEPPLLLPMEEVVARCFATRRLGEEEARDVVHGRALSPGGTGAEPVAALGPDGRFLAILSDRAGRRDPDRVLARPEAVFAEAG